MRFLNNLVLLLAIFFLFNPQNCWGMQDEKVSRNGPAYVYWSHNKDDKIDWEGCGWTKLKNYAHTKGVDAFETSSIVSEVKYDSLEFMVILKDFRNVFKAAKSECENIYGDEAYIVIGVLPHTKDDCLTIIDKEHKLQENQYAFGWKNERGRNYIASPIEFNSHIEFPLDKEIKIEKEDLDQKEEVEINSLDLNLNKLNMGGNNDEIFKTYQLVSQKFLSEEKAKKWSKCVNPIAHSALEDFKNEYLAGEFSIIDITCIS